MNIIPNVLSNRVLGFFIAENRIFRIIDGAMKNRTTLIDRAH